MAVLDVLLGGGLTLVATATATFQQARMQSRARNDEREERRREVRRGQAERVFEELSRLVTAYSDQVLHVTSQIANAAAGKELVAVSDAPPAPSVANVEALVSIYFPDSASVVDDFNADARKIIEASTGEIKKHFDDHKDDAPDPKFIKTVHFVMARELSKRASEFSKQLKNAMGLEISQLW